MPYRCPAPLWTAHFAAGFRVVFSRFNRRSLRRCMRILTLLALLSSFAPAMADEWFDGGKLLATGGVSQVEGAGGGGLASWAMITGYGTQDGVGANVHYTVVPLSNYSLQSAGIAVGLFDRLELSYAWQGFDTQNVGAAAGRGTRLYLSPEHFRRQAEAGGRRCL